MRHIVFTFFIFFLGTVGNLVAQDMTYKPKNPAFGGDTFNYQWLQSSAQAQDTNKDPKSSSSSSTRNNLNDFTESLNRQILSSLSRQLSISQLGDGSLKPGSYTVGNYAIDVANSLDGLVVDIIDQTTGQSTQVVIPVF
jgi:curli production assembly/transport component CsgF